MSGLAFVRDAFTTLEVVHEADRAVAKLEGLGMVQPPRGVHAGVFPRMNRSHFETF